MTLKFYNELAAWWPLISPPDDYAEEVEFFLTLLPTFSAEQSATLVDLGSGGGNNALFMKSAFSAVTLVDLSDSMLDVSRQLNPDCEHIQGDIRTVRLERTFDVVFMHDSIDYMITLAELKQAIETAFVHCKAGGMALFVPDAVRETFETSSDHGGEDGEGRSVRYMEWSYDPDEDDTTYTTDYVFMLREDGQPVRVEHEQHIGGLFKLDVWLSLFSEVGFNVEYVIDPFERYIFIARKI